MSFRTSRARAAHLGSAGEGTHHWWTQRLSSVALIPLTILFVIPFGSALGEGWLAVVETYRNPLNAIVAALMIAVSFHHLYQGLQVVIEDYVHDKPWLIGALLANLLVCGLLGFAGVFAVLMIALGGVS